jgi:hypothetical protein
LKLTTGLLVLAPRFRKTSARFGRDLDLARDGIDGGGSLLERRPGLLQVSLRRR